MSDRRPDSTVQNDSATPVADRLAEPTGAVDRRPTGVPTAIVPGMRPNAPKWNALVALAYLLGLVVVVGVLVSIGL